MGRIVMKMSRIGKLCQPGKFNFRLRPPSLVGKGPKIEFAWPDTLNVEASCTAAS
jgi:hypothetical protein